MKRILIADSSKASLVITSEVFKDHFPGVQVVVARTSAEALDLAKSDLEIDVFVLDFDLPDRDGAQTATRIKKLRECPILVTAFERDFVAESIENEVALYDDCLNWIKKPVRGEALVSVVQRFCFGQQRLKRRIPTQIPALFSYTPSSGPEKTSSSTDTSVKRSKVQTLSKESSPKDLSLTAQKKQLLKVIIEDCGLGGVKLKLGDNLNSSGKKLTGNKKLNLEIGTTGVLVVDKSFLQQDEVFLEETFENAWKHLQTSYQAAQQSNDDKYTNKKVGTTLPRLAKEMKTMPDENSLPQQEETKIGTALTSVKATVAWFQAESSSVGLHIASEALCRSLFTKSLEWQQLRISEENFKNTNRLSEDAEKLSKKSGRRSPKVNSSMALKN